MNLVCSAIFCDPLNFKLSCQKLSFYWLIHGLTFVSTDRSVFGNWAFKLELTELYELLKSDVEETSAVIHRRLQDLCNTNIETTKWKTGLIINLPNGDATKWNNLHGITLLAKNPSVVQTILHLGPCLHTLMFVIQQNPRYKWILYYHTSKTGVRSMRTYVFACTFVFNTHREETR